MHTTLTNFVKVGNVAQRAGARLSDTQRKLEKRSKKRTRKDKYKINEIIKGKKEEKWCERCV